MTSECLKIKRIGGSGRVFLKLEGTVLVCNQKNWVFESKLMIPVELIYISEQPRFYKDLLTLVVLIPLLPLLLIAYMFFRGEVNFNETKEMLFPVIGVIVLLEFGMLFALIFNFLFTKKTVCLWIIDTSTKIEFWKKRKNIKHINLFLDELKQKQQEVEDNIDCQPGHAFEIRNVNHFGRAICLCFVFCIPSLIFEKPILLFLGLIPIARYLYTSLALMKQPKELRQAIKNRRRKKWDKALELLLHLYEQRPEYTPAIYLIIDTYLCSEKYDEALSFISKVPEHCFQDINTLSLNIWKWKRIHMRRIENI